MWVGLIWTEWSNKMPEMFFQLRKIDSFAGTASGVLACEALDHDSEIMDYFKSKPYFQAWSASQFAASDGKSKGNVRLQYNGNTAVGKLTSLRFDDARKQIECEASIIDPVAREMLREGVLTGFSIGGQYISKTPMSGGITRYVANPSEVSVVDRPCLPNATFSSVKADGSEELRKFQKTETLTDRILLLKLRGVSDAMICNALGVTAGDVWRAKSYATMSRI